MSQYAELNCSGSVQLDRILPGEDVGAWYFIQRALSVGFEYGRYHVNKIGRSAADLKNVNPGDSVNFDTLEFGVRFDF